MRTGPAGGGGCSARGGGGCSAGGGGGRSASAGGWSWTQGQVN
jgi:hypothetical protein